MSKIARSNLRRADLKPHAERFWEKVLPKNERGCRLWWTGDPNGTTPSFTLGQDDVGRNINVKVTRVAWALKKGRIKQDEILRQTCGDRRCVEHLKLVPAWLITRAAVLGQSKPTRARDRERFMKLVAKQRNGCWFWQGAFVGSYGTFWLDGKSVGAHVASFILFKGPLPPGHIVRHLKCSNPMCVAPKHLASGTHADNAQDTIRDKTVPRGSNNGMAILSEKEVALILGRYAKHKGAQSLLAHKFGVTPQVIYNIVARKTWQHVKPARGEKRITKEEAQAALRYAKGSRLASKVTEKDVVAMRKAHENGESASSIAERFGLKHPQTYAILSRRAWRHV